VLALDTSYLKSEIVYEVEWRFLFLILMPITSIRVNGNPIKTMHTIVIPMIAIAKFDSRSGRTISPCITNTLMEYTWLAIYQTRVYI
jgi:hypothetical protein